VQLLRSAAFGAIPGVAHAFSTRRAGGGPKFDLGPADGETPDVAARRRSFLHAAGLGRARPTILRQVHGAAIVAAVPGLALPSEADGAYRPGDAGDASPVPAVRTADCVAVLLVHPHAKAVAAVHAGWRGAAAGIGARAVSRFETDGLAACDLVAALGPAILGCCFEVGGEVVSALTRSCGSPSGFVAESASGRTTVDLHAALSAQLVEAGVLPGSIHRAPYCTRCRQDLFFSYRGEGAAAGRMMAVVGPAAGP
jgi:YfiH family protein